MKRKLRLTVASSLAAIVLAASAQASETITYTYDAQGRVVSVARSGTVNDNIVTSYTYDDADNRVNVTTTGAPSGSDPGSGASVSEYRWRYVFNGRFFVAMIKN